MNEFLCDFEAPYLFFFSENTPTLLYYSHLTGIVASLLIVFLLLGYKPARAKSKLLILILATFSAWSLVDMFLWATNRSDLVMFWWTAQILFEPLLYIFSIFLYYTYTRKRAVPFHYILTSTLLVLPLVLFLPTNLTLTEINLFDCSATEHPFVVFYTYFIEILSIIIISIILIGELLKKQSARTNREISLFAFGLVLFLASFTSGNIIGSLTEDWELAQYGLFGMPVFVGIITYLVVEYKIYNLSIIGAQALVVTLWGLVGSLLLVVQSTTSRVVAAITLLLSVIFGIFLLRSVKREVRQREQLEVLTQKLEAANERLKELDKAKSEFVSIASHQLRSPLTAIRGYASMLAEGSFGKMPEKAMESAKRIEESAKLMAMSIEDYLNVSRIESGNMKYNLSDFNVRDMVDNLCDDLRPEALKKGLILLFRSNIQSRGIVNADVGKTNQIIHNLINNSIKYTERGSVSVFVRDDSKKKRIYIDITDTGIGMSKETIAKLFHKFTRADNANSVNVSGTGLGLYVALKMAEQMGGTITCQSDGDGKGSTFTIELPLSM
ncbi:MAG: hypothetical protein RL538_249 [Candidatus Parcubacteria bacterium]|jgi:signal transduction histidine kinase